MEVMARREAFDFMKPGVLMTRGEHKATQQVRLPGVERNKPHPDLKRDSGLLRNDPYRTTGPNHFRKFLVDFQNVRPCMCKKRPQSKFATGMPLICHHKPGIATAVYQRFLTYRLR